MRKDGVFCCPILAFLAVTDLGMDVLQDVAGFSP